jgi:hypothetical protein
MSEQIYSNEEISSILKNYQEKKEYRKNYYKNRYHTNEEYKMYMRDYNKIRYEERTFNQKCNEDNRDKLLLKKANNLKKWFDKHERPGDFEKKCNNDYLLLKNL